MKAARFLQSPFEEKLLHRLDFHEKLFSAAAAAAAVAVLSFTINSYLCAIGLRCHFRIHLLNIFTFNMAASGTSEISNNKRVAAFNSIYQRIFFP